MPRRKAHMKPGCWRKESRGPLDVVSGWLAGVGWGRVAFAPHRVTPATLAAEERPPDDEQAGGGPSHEQRRPKLKPGARNQWRRFKCVQVSFEVITLFWFGKILF